MIKKNKPWHFDSLQSRAFHIIHKWRSDYQHRSAASFFWLFYFKWQANTTRLVSDFIAGRYQPEPMHKIYFSDEVITIWSLWDRLNQRLLLHQIKSTFKHVISSYCYHLTGPDGVKGALDALQLAMKSKKYHYVLRLDIKGYYANIDHGILIQQLCQAYDDPRLHRYFASIVSPLIDDNGVYIQNTKGLPRRSPLSPFLGPFI